MATDNQNDNIQPKPPTRMDMLKAKAKTMGLAHSNNIGEDTLAKMIEDKLNGSQEEPAKEAAPLVDPRPAESPAPNRTAAAAVQAPVSPHNPFEALGMSMEQAFAMLAQMKAQNENNAVDAGEAPINAKPGQARTLAQMMREDGMKLVRLRITNLDPKKKDLPGEILTIANEYIGTVRKFVPFGEHTDNGYHVPYCIYEMMRDRKFVSITVKRDKQTGREVPTYRDAQEFALEVLPPLTERELRELATAQTAAGSVEATAEG